MAVRHCATSNRRRHSLHLEEEGADELVFLDITASHEGREIMLDVVRRTAPLAQAADVQLTVQGADVEAIVEAGAMPTSFVISLAQMRDGAVWLGTRDSGLLKIKDRQVTPVSKMVPHNRSPTERQSRPTPPTTTT